MNQAPQTETDTETHTTSTADDGSHLVSLRIPDDDDDGFDDDAPFQVGEDGEPLHSEPPALEQISMSAFWTVFQTAFNMPAMINRNFAPLGIQDSEKEGARAASDATYHLLEIYYPSALMPQSETLAHLMIAGPFFLGKAMIVREIIRAAQARNVTPRDKSTPEQPPKDENTQTANWGVAQ